MKAYLIEAFLENYYLIEAICGKVIAEYTRRGIFVELARLFRVSGEPVLKGYLAESNSEIYRSVEDLAGYERLCRMIEYSHLTGRGQPLSETDRVILAQKRGAMTLKNEIVKSNMNLTGESIRSALTDVSEKGNVDASAILAFLEYHGICTEANRVSAVSRIRKCADWNNLLACFMGIEYDAGRREEYLAVLRSVFAVSGREDSYRFILESVKEAEGPEKDPAAEILEKAFCKGTVKRSTYVKHIRDISRSGLVSREDKEKILHYNNKELLEQFSKIPFDAVRGRKAVFNSDVCKSMPLVRDDELRSILCNLKVSATCTGEVCKPLLIVSNDEYVSDVYCSMISSGFAGNVSVIDAGNLSHHDFDTSAGNVFLRGIADTHSADTVFIIRSCEELDHSMLEELCKMLDHSYRKRFNLYHSGISLDLSSLGFVIFASGPSAAVAELSEICDTVTARRVSAAEKPGVIADIFKREAVRFGCADALMSDECVTYLGAFEARQIDRILESALRTAIYDGADTITLDAVKGACNLLKIRTNSKDFGFNGGVNYA